MKKYIIFTIILITTCFTVCTASNNDDRFINALKNCTPYNASEDLEINGLATTSTKQMQGWKNDKCQYKETVTFNNNTITTVCRFTKPQIKEIVSVADAYYLTQQYTHEEIDTSSLESIKNNPLAQVLSKYLQDPSVCTMEGL